MKTVIALALLIPLLLASAVYLYIENKSLREALQESRSHEWMAFMGVLSNGTHTVISVEIFDKKSFELLSETHYLFKGDITAEEPLLLIDIYPSLYKIPRIKSYKQVSPPEAKPIENATQLLISPLYNLHITNVEKEGDSYVVKVVDHFLLDPKTLEWKPVRKAVFNSTDAAEAIQWAINHGSGRIEIANIKAVLTHPINITRHDVPIIMSGCNFTLKGEKDEN